MADLRGNIGGYTTAGVVIGLDARLVKLIVYGTPLYDVVIGTLGRWGEGVFAMILGFVLDFADTRVPFLENLRIPGRMWVYGVYKLVDEAIDMMLGKGFAYITADGSIKTDPQDTITAVYMQKGDSVYQVAPGSRTGGFGVKRFIAVGDKRVYYFEAPYELQASAPRVSK